MGARGATNRVEEAVRIDFNVTYWTGGVLCRTFVSAMDYDELQVMLLQSGILLGNIVALERVAQSR